MAKKQKAAATRPPRTRSATVKTSAAPPIAVPPPVDQPPNVVLCGYERGSGKVREFARLSRVAHGNERTVVVDGRLYEYTGTDADGRRVYRDHTRLT